MRIELPYPIYEENIISYNSVDGDYCFLYVDEQNPNCRHELRFTKVYYSEFIDFELMTWPPGSHFGLEIIEPEESDILNGRLKTRLELLLKYPQYRHMSQLKHYRLIVDDVGIFNIIAKDLDLKQYDTISE